MSIACAAVVCLSAQPAFDLLPSRGPVGTSVLVRLSPDVAFLDGNVKFGGVIAEVTGYFGSNNIVQVLVPPGLDLGRVRVTVLPIGPSLATVPAIDGVDFEVTGPGGGPGGTLSIALGALTRAQAVNPADNTLLTVDGREFLVIDLATGKHLGSVTLDTLDANSPGPFQFGLPAGLAVNPANNTAAVITNGASPSSAALTVIDLSTRTVSKSIPLDAGIALRLQNGVAIDAATNTAVLRIDDPQKSILLVNLDTGELRSVATPSGGNTLLLTLIGTTVAVNSANSKAVLLESAGLALASNLYVIDLRTAAIQQMIRLPPSCVSVAINENTNTAVVLAWDLSVSYPDEATDLFFVDLATGSTQTQRLDGITGHEIQIDSGTNVGLLAAVSGGERVVRSIDLATGSMSAPYRVRHLNFLGQTSLLVNSVTHTGALLVAPFPFEAFQGIIQIYDHATGVVPAITGIVPATASEGETVAILGHSFGTGAAPVRVSFNGVEGRVVACGRSSILARVPSGAASGPVTVTVNGRTSADAHFELRKVSGLPAITSISPNQGPVSGGTRVLIKGRNLTGGGFVRIGGAAPSGLEMVDAETIAVFTPPRLPGQSDLEIVQSNGSAALANGFTYNIGHAGESFVSGGRMTVARGYYPAASTLPDGQILVSGGNSGSFFRIGNEYLTAETFDPSGPRVPKLFEMGEVRGGHTSTAFASGKLLVAGGGVQGQSNLYWTAAAEVFDPGSGAFTRVGRMTESRGLHQSVLLPNGLVLLLGGASSSADLFHPASGTFTPTGETKALRSGATATLLADGRVLVTGGASNQTAELFDPETGKFRMIVDRADANAPIRLNEKRAGHSAVLLPSGEVLLAGGGGNTGEIFNPETQRFTSVPNQMSEGVHTASSAVLLHDGQVLLLAGLASFDFGAPPIGFSDIYDTSTGRFASGPTLVNARSGAPAVLLRDGRVAVFGGLGQDSFTGLANVEILQ